MTRKHRHRNKLARPSRPGAETIRDNRDEDCWMSKAPDGRLRVGSRRRRIHRTAPVVDFKPFTDLAEAAKYIDAETFCAAVYRLLDRNSP